MIFTNLYLYARIYRGLLSYKKFEYWDEKLENNKEKLVSYIIQLIVQWEWCCRAYKNLPILILLSGRNLWYNVKMIQYSLCQAFINCIPPVIFMCKRRELVDAEALLGFGFYASFFLFIYITPEAEAEAEKSHSLVILRFSWTLTCWYFVMKANDLPCW